MIAYTQIEQTGNDADTTREEIVTITTENENNTDGADAKKTETEVQPEDADAKKTTTPEEVVIREPKCNNDGSYMCYSDTLKLDFRVHVQKDGITAPQRCYVLTIHDLGFDYNEFQDLIMTPEMASLRSRIVWLHVNLPGQSVGDADLEVKKYPTLDELGREMATILDYFKVPQAIVIGDGAGANVAVNFAKKCPNRCLGIALIEPIASPASFIEIMKHKMQNLNMFTKNNLNAHEKANMILSHIKRINSHEHLSGSFNMNETETHMYENRNIKNLSLFAESFINRPSLVENLETLGVDVLTVAGKQSTAYHESKKFYKSLQDSRRRNPKTMINCPLLELDGLVKENPDRLAVGFQYFLQGIGLVSAMPLRRLSSRQSSLTSGSGSGGDSAIISAASSAKNSVVSAMANAPITTANSTPPSEAASAPSADAITEDSATIQEVETIKKETSAKEAPVEENQALEKPSSTSSQSESTSQLVSSNPSLNNE